MKHTLYIYTAIMMMLLVAACNNDTDMDTEGQMLPVMINTAMQTRAAIKTTFAPGDAITLTTTYAAVTLPAVTYTLANAAGNWTPAGGQTLLIPAQGDVSIAATHTATNPANVYAGTDIATPPTQRSVFADDLDATATTQTGTIARSGTTAGVTLNFAHCHALLNVAFTEPGGQAVTPAGIARVEAIVSLAPQPAGGTPTVYRLGIDDTAWSATATTSPAMIMPVATGRLHTMQSVIVTTTGGREYTHTFAAQTYEANREYTLTIALAEETATFAISTTDDFGWSVQPGKNVIPDVSGYNYTIRTEEELIAFARAVDAGNLTATAIQMANIELTEPWVPITNVDNTNQAFAGTYNGNGYTISGINITQNYDHTGFFGCTYNATLTGIHLRGVNINNKSQFAGALVGDASNTTADAGCISLCSAEGTISVSSNFLTMYVGGLVGYASRVHISRCRTACTLVGANNLNGFGNLTVGDLVGYTGNGMLAVCQATGNVKATALYDVYIVAGGLAGKTESTETWSCYATGHVEVECNSNSTIYAGGLIGYNYSNINNSYATGDVTTSSGDADSLIGLNYGSIGATAPCHATGNVNGTPNTPSATRQSTITGRTETFKVYTTVWEPGKTYSTDIVERTFTLSDVWMAEEYPQLKFEYNGQ